MSNPARDDSEMSRSRLLVVCGILLTATLINYACRMTFNQNKPQIEEAFQIKDKLYGEVEAYFGLGFACGGLLFGVLSDFVKVRWLYPAVVLAWAAAGASSAWVDSVFGLEVSRFLLGLFEAGHWPCALRTTQRLFKPAQRSWGNSLLQSGAALGAILTPLLIAAVHRRDPTQWRATFLITGLLAVPWVIVWWLTVSDADLQRPVIATDERASGVGEERTLREHGSWWELLTSARWWVLIVITISINTTWQFIRVWLPGTLEQQKGYDHEFTQYFMSAYYGATFLGSLGAGWLVSRLAQGGVNVHRARVAIFLGCSLLVLWAVPTAFFEPGWLYLGSWLVIGVGGLGMFPIYYSLNQELSAKRQGRVSGLLSFTSWLMQFFVNRRVGRAFESAPDSQPYFFGAIGVLPLLACLVLIAFWGRRDES